MPKKPKPKIITIGEKGNEAKRTPFEADLDGNKWEGQVIETPVEKIDMNQILGTTDDANPRYTTRRYDIALPPANRGEQRPSDSQIVDFHKASLLGLLLKDGWVQAGDITSLRRKDDKFLYIFIPATPIGTRTPVTHNEMPLKLQNNPFVKRQ